MVVDGIYYAIGLAIGGAVVSYLLNPWFGLSFYVFAGFCLYFFRDPNRVVPDGLVGVEVGLGIRAWHHAEIAGLGIDRVEPSILSGVQPGNVVANRPDFPALKSLGRNQHRDIRLAARAGEGCGDIGLLAVRIFDAHNQHVFG